MDITKRFNRVIAIYFQLQAKPIVKAQDLAERFDVSLRTIYRDLKSLELAGIPIVSEPTVGYSLVDGYKIPPTLFSKEEALSFVAAEKLVQKYFDKDLGSYFSSALNKMKSILRSSDKENIMILESEVYMKPTIPVFNQKVPSALAILFESIAAQKVIKITYHSSNSAFAETRIVEPVGVFHESNFWYFMAFCHLRKDYRQFRLDRIENIEKLEDKYSKKHKNLAYYLNRKEKKVTTTIRIKVSKEVARHLVWERNFFGFVSEQESGDDVLMHFESSNIDHDFSRWFLMFADTAEILEPQELKTKVKSMAQAIMNQMDAQPKQESSLST
ncbi:helix-turn-helix transcriptional regulator [Sphingobacterium hungaricum]